MRFTICLLILFISQNFIAQEVQYSIGAPPGARWGGNKVPQNSVDNNRFYKYNELDFLAKPVVGWEQFYYGLKALDYPQKAKAQKLQTSLTIEYRIDEHGVIDSVYVRSFNWSKCVDCEKLVLDYFKNAQWLPGKIRDIPVKTIDEAYIEFTIYDPNSKKKENPFGF